MSVVSLSVGLFLFHGFMACIAFFRPGVIVIRLLLDTNNEKCDVREVIIMTDKVIRVERGSNKAKSRNELPIRWDRVALERPQYEGHPKNFVLKTHGKRIEVGCFLVESEREKLAEQLRKMLVMPTSG